MNHFDINLFSKSRQYTVFHIRYIGNSLFNKIAEFNTRKGSTLLFISEAFMYIYMLFNDSAYMNLVIYIKIILSLLCLRDNILDFISVSYIGPLN